MRLLVFFQAHTLFQKAAMITRERYQKWFIRNKSTVIPSLTIKQKFDCRLNLKIECYDHMNENRNLKIVVLFWTKVRGGLFRHFCCRAIRYFFNNWLW